MSGEGDSAEILDGNDRILLAPQRLQHELRDIVHRLSERRAAFVGAVVRMAVHHGFDMVAAVDRLAQPLRPELLENLRRLALDRVLHGGIMEHGDAALGANGAKLVFELPSLG